MNDKEKRVRDQRFIEATRKGLTGLEGKFGKILKYLGLPITLETSSLFSSNELPDFYKIPDDNDDRMPTMDEEENEYGWTTPVYNAVDIGYIFDGLSRGLHLEIKYLLENQELTVYYEGHMVYCEIANELECYVPFNEWEYKIDSLYQQAKVKENKRIKEVKEINKQESQRQKMSLLDKLKTKWGI